MKQVLDGDETVVTQGSSGRNEIDNRFRHARDRPQFNGSVQVHQLDGQIQGIEERPGTGREFARHTAVGRQISSAAVATAGLDGDSHAATTKTQVHQLGHGELVFAEHIKTNNTQLGLAVRDVGRNVTVANQQRPGSSTGGGRISDGYPDRGPPRNRDLRRRIAPPNP